MCDVVVCRCFDGAEQNYGFGCRFRQDGNDCYWCYSFGKGAPQQGVVTGLDGDYKITNVPSNAVLLYSYIGMKDQEIAVNGRTTINVVMQEDNMLIDEVVVVGYGVQRKSDLTGAVGSIKSDDLKKDFYT